MFPATLAFTLEVLLLDFKLSLYICKVCLCSTMIDGIWFFLKKNVFFYYFAFRF